MKLKHNKLRNPSILFELLVRQVTTDTLSNKESKAVDILKKHYNNNQIAKEYKIYKTLAEAKNLSETKANVLLNAAIEAHKKLNKAELKRQKYALIADIKENYNIDDFFKAKVDNYKTLASIYMIFEIASNSDSLDTNFESETKYRFSIIESISSSVAKKEVDPVLEKYSEFDKGTKALVYKLMVQKFNEKYSNFDKKQKKLLKEYITNSPNSSTFRNFVNSELLEVKEQIKKVSNKINDEARKVKITEVLNFVEEVPANKSVCEKDIHNLLYYYELLKEFKTETSQ